MLTATYIFDFDVGEKIVIVSYEMLTSNDQKLRNISSEFRFGTEASLIGLKSLNLDRRISEESQYTDLGKCYRAPRKRPMYQVTAFECRAAD